MTLDESNDVTAYWCDRESCDYWRSQPAYSSPQLSDALREHAKDDKERAERGHLLMTQAADMVRVQRDQIRQLEDSVATFRSLAGRISDYFHVNTKPTDDLALRYLRELDAIICPAAATHLGPEPK